MTVFFRKSSQQRNEEFSKSSGSGECRIGVDPVRFREISKMRINAHWDDYVVKIIDQVSEFWIQILDHPAGLDPYALKAELNEILALFYKSSGEHFANHAIEDIYQGGICK